MQIRYDAQGYVEGYAEVGGMPGAVEYTGAVPEGFGPDTCRYYRMQDGELVFDAEKQHAEEVAESAEATIADLRWWLDNYYDKQVSEYLRCQRLGIPYDKDIMALDEQAEEARARIRELNEVINGESA